MAGGLGRIVDGSTGSGRMSVGAADVLEAALELLLDDEDAVPAGLPQRDAHERGQPP